MLYGDFIKEILKWQGIFDGYPESLDSYKIYFELISSKILSVEVLRYCLISHHDNRNKLFPKPFELIDYLPTSQKELDELSKEVQIIIEKVKKEQGEKNA